MTLGKLIMEVPSGNPPNGNILVGGGKETKRDSLSRGDRKGDSLNQIHQGNLMEMWGYRPSRLLLKEVEVAWNGPPKRVIAP